MLQGASNSWFPVILSALSIPTSADQLSQLVDDHWVTLEKAQSQQNIELLRQVGQLNDFAKFSEPQIWEAVQKKRSGNVQQAGEPTDLKSPEWEIFSKPTSVPPNRYFKLRAVQPPLGYRTIFDKIVLVERLREVRALRPSTSASSGLSLTATLRPKDSGMTREKTNSCCSSRVLPDCDSQMENPR
jgi:hypothetical protein